jgi:hypothetical protein
MVLSKKKVRLATIMDDSSLTNHKHGRSEKQVNLQQNSDPKLRVCTQKLSRSTTCSPSTEGTGTVSRGTNVVTTK